MTTERNSLLPGSIGQVAYRERWEGTGGSPTPTYGGSARGGGERRWNSYNHIGNVVGISNASGYFVEAVNTDAFGNPLASTQTGEWASGLDGNRGLTTKELDPAAGMYYFYQRWYDPQTATFASRAPYPAWIEHPYTIGKNTPLRLVDPSGRVPGRPGRFCNETTTPLPVSDNGDWYRLEPGHCTDPDWDADFACYDDEIIKIFDGDKLVIDRDGPRFVRKSPVRPLMRFIDRFYRDNWRPSMPDRPVHLLPEAPSFVPRPPGSPPTHPTIVELPHFPGDPPIITPGNPRHTPIFI